MTSPKAMQRGFLAAVLLALGAGSATATDTRCADGRWTIDDGPLAIGALSIGVIGLRHGEPILDAPCRAVRWALRRADGETRLRALFVCRTDASQRRARRFPLRLRARITDACTHLQGAFGVRRAGAVVRFTATLAGSECASNADCAATAYCVTPFGACGAPGTCEERPQGCPDVDLPVCGCDGQTYGNRCDAAAAGVSVARDGPCARGCGGVAGIPCGDGEFCDLPAGECGSADLAGRCVVVGDACPASYAPVCGCDGTTYVDDCFRQAARVQKAEDGPCGGCTSLLDCLPNEFCRAPDGQCGGRGDCTFIAQVCPTEYDPVCGCDAETYANRCRAAMYAVSIAGAGPCDGVCGGIAGIPCPDGQICELPAGTCHGADFQGRCVPGGDYCIQVFDPVCGCDGHTYPNDCERRRAGVQKAHHGPCKCEPPCCALGNTPTDTDGDGCSDACLPTTKCEVACDCYPDPPFGNYKFCEDCLLLCPNCGNYLTCEDGGCVERCGPFPPDVVACFTDAAS
jgi:hypothetical protein